MLCLKYVFFVFNFLLFCFGVATAAVGLWTLTDPAVLQNYIELPFEKLYIVSYVMTVVGFVLVIVGFVGCCGVLMDNACFLCLFSTVMIILLLLGAAAGIVIWVAMHNDEFGKQVEDFMFRQISGNDAFDKMQENLKCCGVRGYRDYVDRDKAIPQSCKDENGVYFDIGCWTLIKDALSKKIHVLGGMTATLIVIGIISAVVSIIILCSVRQAAKAI